MSPIFCRECNAYKMEQDEDHIWNHKLDALRAKVERYEKALREIAKSSGHISPCKGYDLKACLAGCDVAAISIEALEE